MEPDPALSGRFEGLDLLPALQQGVQEAGFVELRPIQAAALPEALKGRDVLGLARRWTLPPPASSSRRPGSWRGRSKATSLRWVAT